MSIEALEAVPWERFEPTLAHVPADEVPRALRSLALAGEAATEEDCYPLYSCLLHGNARLPSAAAAALPFLLALAADPRLGARITLLELLAELALKAATAEPHLVDDQWPTAWRLHRDAIRALPADPDPAVRRAAIPLAGGTPALLDRWRTETDPAVRLPVLLALAGAAAAERDAAGGTEHGGGAERGGAAGEAGDGPVEEVRAVLDGVLRDGGPVMKVAAVHAWARLDPDVPVRRVDLLVEILTDPAVRPGFEAAWRLPGVDSAFSREDVVHHTTALLHHAPLTAVSFVARIASREGRPGDTELRRIILDGAWRLAVLRPSAAPGFLPVAGRLLADPDGAVRLRAANLLAALGRRAAPYADQLAGLLDDPGRDDDIEGTVGDFARWALTRLGDTRALPGLIERLCEPYRGDWSRAWTVGDPRLPDTDDVLLPLREHAAVLLPAMREEMRRDAAEEGRCGLPTSTFLRVLREWGEDALPALPEVVPLLSDTTVSLGAADVLAAMGPAAASAGPALRDCAVLDFPGNHRHVAWAAWRIGGDAAATLRMIGAAVLDEEGPHYGPVHLLADFGSSAAPYTARVRHIMERSESWWPRLHAAVALWSITGDPGPSVPVLEGFILPIADGGDHYGTFGRALRALLRIGVVTPAACAALREVRGFDRRLSQERDYQAVLEDEELRALIEDVLALE